MRLSKLAKSIIREIDLAGWVNSVNDGDCERGEVIKKVQRFIAHSGIRYQGKDEMERVEEEIVEWFDSQLF
ncbi:MULTISPECIES: hypothetical protein [Lactococcus]|uniref:Uncharacterized protein n=2 Tax=Lactococcus TaxID=1357 RepID=A0AA43PEW5_9LACT|nr:MULTISPECIES: hypothetical protein [Lactococcus]MDH7959427.1 hypothetical protein [Lactococcus garvieae]MDT2727222.1 hypothetical protein [Lactococcus formosensis]QSR11996.1 hypothetical protein J0J35_06135 [Lactococcus sp. LG606]BDM76561.1 hypothetical protein LGMS210922A_15060 [Lactococcus garvieae]BDW51829.1 hypothetical protein LG21E68_15040 [Lactococcus garvieae]